MIYFVFLVSVFFIPYADDNALVVSVLNQVKLFTIMKITKLSSFVYHDVLELTKNKKELEASEISKKIFFDAVQNEDFIAKHYLANSVFPYLPSHNGS